MTNTRKLNIMSDGITYTRNLVLRGMCTIYLIAFVSFYYQSSGLFGNNGILPARLQIESSTNNILSNILQKPTLLHFAKYCGLDAEYMLDILSLLGSIISFAGLVSQKVCILPTFAVLWCLYCSLIQVAQLFADQSDYLLLEAGFIMIMLAPLARSSRASPSDKIMFVVLRWLLMRFCFASGIVKFLSRCPLWWNFTALHHHFETMPLPTALAWFSHNFLFGWLKVTNVFSNITELSCVWIFFFPHRGIRRYMFYWQMFLQFNIIATGNYGFLNFMLPILMLSLLDDKFFAELNVKRVIVLGTKVLMISYLLFFGLGFILSLLLDERKFDETHLEVLRQTIRLAPLIAAFILISTFLINLVSHPAIIQARTLIQKIYGVNILISFSMIAIAMVIVSMVPHGNLDRSTNITNTELGSFYQQIKKFHIINEYGQSLRKMRNERYEIIYEHAEDIDGPWTEYKFLYKPSNVNSSLPFAGPYFPRLDFKLYDAAPSNYRKELWTVSLAYRLLQEEQNVLALLGEQSSTTSSPTYVRGILYKFRYTTRFNSPTSYWMRLKMSEYFPAFSLDNISPYLRSIKISPHYKDVEIQCKTLQMVLDYLRSQVRLIEGSLLVFGVLVAGLITIITKRIYYTLSCVE